DHVVDDDAATVAHVADQAQRLGHVAHIGAATFLHESDAAFEVGRILLRHLAAAWIGRHDHEVAPAFCAYVLGKDRQSGQVVERDVEESLDLPRVQVHSHYPVAARSAEEISHQAG